MIIRCTVIILLFSLSSASDVLAEEPTSAELEFFEKKIRPVLVKECYSCHSTEAKSVKSGLLLDTREGIRRGGESGHAVVPGNLEESLLIEAIRFEGLEMPPKKQLPAHIVADLEQWIRMGAPDPREGKSAPIRHSINFETAREFWSFQPIKTPEIPLPRNGNWSGKAIDRFVLRKLESLGLEPAPDAQPRVFLRRLYFDLTGLPPTPQQVEEFLSDTSEKNLQIIIDRLLASDRFGERWGRHWMDVVRYAESTGMERNYTFPEAWRYRDYVITAFNSDKPFDRFLTEQVAGDLLEFSDNAERDNNLIATGMLAMGPKSLNERDKETFAMDIVDEQIDVVSRAFLGLTASCARCHDHKFDPIPQTEYYQLAGIFRSTDTFYGTGGGGGNRQGGKLLALRENEVVPVSVAEADKKGGKKNANKLAGQLKAQRDRLKKLEQQENVDKQIAAAKKQIAQFEKQLKAAKSDGDETPVAADTNVVMAVADSSKPSDTQLRIRGEANERAQTVPRGFLTIATLVDTPQPPADESGRKELAEWLTQPENPLPARVTVNRIWQHLFGQGIVRTVNNFGANGDRPSHPELLDYLAQQMKDSGWSVKAMIRTIVLSRTYRQSSIPNSAALEIDPENRYLWRMNPRRLEAEAIRDAVLAVSGRLDLSPGEKSIVRTIGNGDVGRNLKPEQFATSDAKRSVYLPIVRGVVPEILQLFDFPEPSIIADSRDVTTVPTQALYMMNSPFLVEQSREMADRLLAERSDDAERIQYGYLLTLGRTASDEEVQRSLKFIVDACKKTDENEKGKDDSNENAWAGFCQVLLASAEFRYLE